MTVMLNRRQLLGRAAASLPLLAGTFSSTSLWAGPNGLPRTLIVFLRGAYDANSLLVPYASSFYYESRPNIAIARPDGTSDGAQKLDADWALAPATTESLMPLWQKKQLAFVPFAGSEDVSRSHFETQDNFELGQGVGGSLVYRNGFMNRLAGTLGVQKQPGREALAFTDQLPLIFQGKLAVGNQGLRSVGRAGVDERQANLIRSMYAQTPLSGAVDSGFDTRREVLQEMGEERDMASRNAIGSKGFEAEARRVAKLMRERVALGFIDVGGWDTHANQGAALGGLATRLSELSAGLAAFATEMGPQWQNTTVIVVSEFGRTFRENGNRGTDHGHGTVYWVMGGGLKAGGKVVGPQQQLRADTLFQDRDMPALTDYRAMLAGLWGRQYGLTPAQQAQVFPGLKGSVDLGLV